MLTDIFKPKKIKLTVKRVGRPLIHIKLPTIAYLPPLEKACYINQAPIHNYQKYQTSSEFKVCLNCYLSQHPHLEFITFHQYEHAPTQVIFKNTRLNTKVAVLLSEFREYEEIKVGGYVSIAKSLDDILEKR